MFRITGEAEAASGCTASRTACRVESACVTARPVVLKARRLLNPHSQVTAMSDPPVTLEVTPEEGGDHDGQAIQGGIVEGRKHAGLRFIEQVGQEQGRIDSR